MRRVTAGFWQEIDKLEDADYSGLLIHAPELVDLDFNPEGVAPGYWQDGPVDVQGKEFPRGTWIAARWCSEHDHWTEAAVNPTHFLKVKGPVETLGERSEFDKFCYAMRNAIHSLEYCVQALLPEDPFKRQCKAQLEAAREQFRIFGIDHVPHPFSPLKKDED